MNTMRFKVMEMAGDFITLMTRMWAKGGTMTALLGGPLQINSQIQEQYISITASKEMAMGGDLTCQQIHIRVKAGLLISLPFMPIKYLDYYLLNHFNNITLIMRNDFGYRVKAFVSIRAVSL